MDLQEEVTSLSIPELEAKFDPLLEGKAGAQLDFELCVMLLDTHPSKHYQHLEHLLKFESGRISSSHTNLVGEGDENIDDLIDSRFSPFSLPDPVGTP